MTSLTQQLVRRVLTRPVTAEDLVTCERYIRDWLGSYVAGAAASTGRLLIAGYPRPRDLDTRVFLAAALSHVTETDDLHRASVTHPACVVIPAAWLLARQRYANATTFLHAVIVGYEVMTRIGEALGPAHYRVFHNTATAGVFGAAAAAAHVLGLSEDAWVWALGNAGTQAAGVWQFNEEGAMSKPLHAGHAAAAGLRAAHLAQHGFTGAARILEGDKGFFRAFCPDAQPDAVLADAPDWKIGETSIKPYPCCRHVHAAIDAALAIRDTIAGDALPRGVRVLSYPAALDVTDRPAPRSPSEARFSMQYAVVRTLLCGRPGMAAFDASQLADARVHDLLKRTSVGIDADFEAAYPRSWGAAVEIELADGTRRSARVEAAAGDPERPLSNEQLDAKLLDLFAWAGFTQRRARPTLRRCRELAVGGPLFDLPSPA